MHRMITPADLGVLLPLYDRYSRSFYPTEEKGELVLKSSQTPRPIHNLWKRIDGLDQDPGNPQAIGREVGRIRGILAVYNTVDVEELKTTITPDEDYDPLEHITVFDELGYYWGGRFHFMPEQPKEAVPGLRLDRPKWIYDDHNTVGGQPVVEIPDWQLRDGHNQYVD